MDHNVVESTMFNFQGQKFSKISICGEEFDSTKQLTNDQFWSYCGKWYEDNLNLTQDQFRTYNFKNGFSKGDIIFLIGSKPKNLEKGDIIVFMSTIRSDPIIHRVVNKGIGPDDKYYCQTTGDHNRASGDFEMLIPEDNVL